MEKLISCDDPMGNDNDEAESEDEDMKSDNEEEPAAALAAEAPKNCNSLKTPIKQ